MRNLLAVILGVMVASVAVMGVESLGHSVYPPPPGISADDPRAVEVYASYIKTAPFLALVFPLLAWATGAFVGGAVAAYAAAGRRTCRFGTIVGLVFLIMGAMMMWMIPHPWWFMLAAPFACLIPGWFGGLVGARRT